MAKLTLDNGTVYEGSVEEIKGMLTGSRFTKGDIVKAVGESVCGAIKPGEILRFKEFDVDDSETPYRADRLDGSDYGWFTFGGLIAHEEPEVEPIKVGDYVKTLTASKYRHVGERELAIVEEVDFNSETGHTVSVRPVNNERNQGLFKPEQLALATDEEVAEVKAQAERASFAVGDYVRFKNDVHEHKAGKISVIRRIDADSTSLPLGLSKPGGGYDGWADYRSVEKITAEEAAKLQAEQAEIERWAKIRRKPNEFKKGDIVRGKRYSDNSTKFIGEVEDVEPDMTGVRSGDGHYHAVSISDATLIAPVEARFDVTN